MAIYYGHTELALTDIPALDIALVFLSITSAWLYSIITNNLADVDIDTISNADRVTITKSINTQTYQSIGWVSIAFAISCALLVSFSYAFTLALFIGVYFIYSMPPLRIKRFFLISKLLLGINALVLAIAGYVYITDRAMHEFPAEYLPFFLVGMTLALNFIDIKDYAGDKQAEIQTMPVLFGPKNAKLVIGVSFILCHLILYYTIGDPNLLVPLLFGGALQFYLVHKKHYQESLILVTHLLSLLFIFAYLLTNQI